MVAFQVFGLGSLALDLSHESFGLRSLALDPCNGFASWVLDLWFVILGFESLASDLFKVCRVLIFVKIIIAWAACGCGCG